MAKSTRFWVSMSSTVRVDIGGCTAIEKPPLARIIFMQGTSVSPSPR